jgi:hypothetical protein
VNVFFNKKEVFDISKDYELVRFTDFDRLLKTKELIITLLGAALLFVLGYFGYVFAIPIAPYGLSLSLSVLIIVSIYTRNMASSLIIGLVAGITITSQTGGSIDFVLGYIVFTTLLSLMLAIMADRLRLTLSWVKFYFLFNFIFALFFIILGILSESVNETYWSLGIGVGTTGDPFFDTDLPMIGIFAIFFLVVGCILYFLPIKGSKTLRKQGARNHGIFGVVMFIVGQLLTFGSYFLYSSKITNSQLQSISDNPSDLGTLNDLFSNQSDSAIGVVLTNPMSIFMIVAATTILTGIGLIYVIVAINEGTIEGHRGGIYVTFFAAPIGTILFFIIGNYYLQDLLIPGGFFIEMVLYPVYLAMIWIVLSINQLLAFLVLFLLNKFIPVK